MRETPRMQSSRIGSAIWIQPEAPVGPATGEAAPSACSACSSPQTLRAAVDAAFGVEPPELHGRPDEIERVLAALSRVRVSPGDGDIVASGRIKSLHLGDGEATLTLRMGQGLCGDAHALAERSFEALRHALPDTDLYLKHDRPTTCAGRSAGMLNAAGAAQRPAHPREKRRARR